MARWVLVGLLSVVGGRGGGRAVIRLYITRKEVGWMDRVVLVDFGA